MAVLSRRAQAPMLPIYLSTHRMPHLRLRACRRTIRLRLNGATPELPISLPSQTTCGHLKFFRSYGDLLDRRVVLCVVYLTGAAPTENENSVRGVCPQCFSTLSYSRLVTYSFPNSSGPILVQLKETPRTIVAFGNSVRGPECGRHLFLNNPNASKIAATEPGSEYFHRYLGLDRNRW